MNSIFRSAMRMRIAYSRMSPRSKGSLADGTCTVTLWVVAGMARAPHADRATHPEVGSSGAT